MNYNVPLDKTIFYTFKYQQDKGTPLSYIPSDSYLQRFLQTRNDPTRVIPHQGMKKFAKNGNEGLYGWTYKAKDGAIRIREDLIDLKKLETDIHECIHTPDEYETRVLTHWILSSMFKVRERYKTRPKEYFH